MGFLFAVWFIGWFVLASVIDGKIGEALTNLKTQGVDVICDRRSIKGFPFRIGLHCDGVRVGSSKGQFQGQIGALRTTAILYDPGTMIAEMDSPFKLSTAAGDLTAKWKRMRFFADAKLSGGFDLLSLNYAMVQLRSPMLGLLVYEGALHLRPSPKIDGVPETDKALDIAGNANGISSNLPNRVTIPPLNFSFDGMVNQAYSKLVLQRLPLAQFLQDGVTMTIRSSLISVGHGGQLALAGKLELHQDKTLSGTMRIGVAEPKAVAAWASKIDPNLHQMVALLGQSVAGMGKKTKFGKVELQSITIQLDHGTARLGFIQLGKIPPLRLN